MGKRVAVPALLIALACHGGCTVNEKTLTTDSSDAADSGAATGGGGSDGGADGGAGASAGDAAAETGGGTAEGGVDSASTGGSGGANHDASVDVTADAAEDGSDAEADVVVDSPEAGSDAEADVLTDTPTDVAHDTAPVDASEASVPDAPQDGTSCDANLDDDPTHCGACGHACTGPQGASVHCRSGRCGYTIGAVDSVKWTANGTVSHIAVWPDGVVHFGTFQVDPATGVATPFPFIDYEYMRRTSIWVEDGQGRYILAHQVAAAAYTQSGTRAFTFSNYGCCDYTMNRPLAIDPVAGLAQFGNRRYDLTNGGAFASEVNVNVGNLAGYNLMDGAFVYTIGLGMVARSNFATGTASWTRTLLASGELLSPGALTAEGDLIVLAAEGKLFKLLKTGADGFSGISSTPLPPNYIPVCVVSANRVFSGTGEPSFEVRDVATGNLLWSAPLPGVPTSALLADDGLVYVYTPSAARILAFDVDTGTELYVFTGMPGLSSSPMYNDIVLRDGILYAAGADRAVAVRVPSAHYDPNAPWPVPFHDNQRTSNKAAPLTY
jgi:hypothetical protein